MNLRDKKLIDKAAKSLQLLNVLLSESRFSRPNDMPGSGKDDFSYMTKTAVEFSHDDPDVLIIKISLGLRLTGPQNGDVYVEIEADFIVLYQIISPLNKDQMRAFSEFNGVHNVWPFWRQHVFDIVQRGGLPQINIPLYSWQT